MADNDAVPVQAGQDSTTTANSPIQSSPLAAHSALIPVDPHQESGQPLGTYVSRLSNGQVPSNYDPETDSGLEADVHVEKEVVHPEKEVVIQPASLVYELPEHQSGEAEEDPLRKHHKLGWLSLRLLIGVLVIVMILGVGLGVGLGIGLKAKYGQAPYKSAPYLLAFHRSHPANPPSPTASSSPSDFSTVGAFNGTGIAIGSQTRIPDLDGQTNLFFQHHTGELRWLDGVSDAWIGGGAASVLAIDAKNATPISTIILPANASVATVCQPVSISRYRANDHVVACVLC
jgi:hypothetical protein